MNDLNIIDQFMLTFVAYIDSGFGLLTPDVAFLTSILIGIDITLAGLYWALADDKSVIPALIKKVLYVGAFAYIIGNFQFLANIIFQSFAGLGLNATGTGLTISNLLRPGFIAATGYDAAAPILAEVGNLIGPIAFFENFVTIFVLCFAWFVVLITFFVLSIQLFITILEFKLTALAGFVLIPFALWGKTSFLAEKVIGNIVSSGIKLMVLAIIVGIGSTIFSSFSTSFVAGSITLEQALSTVLASLALFMLGIFGPSVAAGLISGAPQLGAGAVAGSALGLNSDLPGTVIAQVTTPVYDTVTGKHLLIPQGTRLLGKYDSKVSFGQSRALVVWQRLNLPNGLSIVIDNLPVTDQAGYAGLEDEVDSHTWNLILGISLSTLLSVGAELAFNGDSDIDQAIQDGAEKNINRAGQKLVERQIDVQPTIKIRHGYPLRVIVHKDIILKPYK
uniref:P-type conjugative transfer protein TrbL n=1 Tax=OCS116 cluster bacterium TaxID=2030921 RepID=A0A2A4YR31_9PROT